PSAPGDSLFTGISGLARAAGASLAAAPGPSSRSPSSAFAATLTDTAEFAMPGPSSRGPPVQINPAMPGASSRAPSAQMSPALPGPSLRPPSAQMSPAMPGASSRAPSAQMSPAMPGPSSGSPSLPPFGFGTPSSGQSRPGSRGSSIP